MKNEIKKFLAYNGRVSITCAMTTELVDEARKIHDLTPVSTAALGRLLTMATIMGSDLKDEEDNITLQIGENYKINTLIYPKDATNKELNYESLDNSVVEIDNNGNICAVGNGETQVKISSGQVSKLIDILVIDKINSNDLRFDNNLSVEANIIKGIDITQNTVSNIKNSISTNYDINIYNVENKLLEENDLVGTGSYINISRDGDTIIEYKVLIYGDVNGDGKINSVDLLVLQRHILEIQKFSGIFLKAGNISKNGKNPSSIDSLLIQRHILELQKIEQK